MTKEMKPVPSLLQRLQAARTSAEFSRGAQECEGEIAGLRSRKEALKASEDAALFGGDGDLDQIQVAITACNDQIRTLETAREGALARRDQAAANEAAEEIEVMAAANAADLDTLTGLWQQRQVLLTALRQNLADDDRLSAVIGRRNAVLERHGRAVNLSKARRETIGEGMAWNDGLVGPLSRSALELDKLLSDLGSNRALRLNRRSAFAEGIMRGGVAA